MKYVLLLLVLGFASLSSADQLSDTQTQLDAQLSNSLDKVLLCDAVMPPSTNGPAGQLIKEWGQSIGLAWTRSGYYNKYIDPLILTIHARIQSGQEVDMNDLVEYKDVMTMTETDEAFVNCPQHVEDFLEALLDRAAFEAIIVNSAKK